MRRFATRSIAILPLAVVAALMLPGCDSAEGARAEPSGKQGERRFALTGFDHVVAAGYDRVEIRVGAAHSVVARGDTGILDALEVKVDGKELEIGRRDSGGFRWGGDKDDPGVTIVVTLPAIRAATIAGSGDMSVDSVKGDAFTGTVAGSGNLRIATMQVREAELVTAGSGDIAAAGTAEKAEVSIAGSGAVDAGGLRTRAAELSIAGSGDARLTVEGEADVSIVGSGDVDLGAKARCKVSKVGSGEVRCGG